MWGHTLRTITLSRRRRRWWGEEGGGAVMKMIHDYCITIFCPLRVFFDLPMIDHRGGQRVWMIMALFARQYIFIVSPFEGNEWMNGLSLQAMKWLLQNVNYYYLQGVLYSLSSCQLLPSRDRMMFTSFQYLCKLLKIVYLSFLMSAGRYVLGRCLKCTARYGTLLIPLLSFLYFIYKYIAFTTTRSQWSYL